MRCPVCSFDLERVLYEGFAVFRCGQCHGYLMAQHRVEGIETCQNWSVDELKEETLAEAQPDSEAVLRCPRCRRKMDKQFIQEPASLHLDVCPECQQVWFDGGELARLQLSHQITPQVQEAAQMQRRLRQMTPEARAEFQRDLKRLKEHDWTIGSVLGEAFLEVLTRRGRYPH